MSAVVVEEEEEGREEAVGDVEATDVGEMGAGEVGEVLVLLEGEEEEEENPSA